MKVQLGRKQKVLTSIKFGLFIISLMFSSLFNFVNAEPSLNAIVKDKLDKSFNLNTYIGNVVYVDFWASWCGPCRKSFPWMQQMHEKYHAQGLKVVAINLDTEKEFASDFLKQLHDKEKINPSFVIGYDPEGNVAQQYGLRGMPSSYIFNRQGQLVYQHVGFFKRQQTKYEQELAGLLEK